jgi:hypothetical protein
MQTPARSRYLDELCKGRVVGRLLARRALHSVLLSIDPMTHAQHLAEVALPQLPNLLELVPA